MALQWKITKNGKNKGVRMTKKRFRLWVNEDGEENIFDNYNQFKTVDLCMPCGKQVTDMLNELEREKEYWRDKALHKELI